MKGIFSFLFSLLAIMHISAQDISRRDADSLLKVLNKTEAALDRVDLLLKLAEFQILKPGELQVDFDSATAYLDEVTLLNKSIKSTDIESRVTLTQAKLLSEKGQREEAKKMTEGVVARLEAGSNKKYLGKAYYDLSGFYNHWEAEQVPHKIMYLEKALGAYRRAGNIEGSAHSLKMLGDLESASGNNQKAIEYLGKALAAYDSVKYIRVHGIYALLGNIYRFQNDFKQALSYELRALRIAEAVADTTMQLCQINNILGAIYREVGRWEPAAKHFKASLETAKRFNDKSAISLLILNVANTYSNSNRPQEALDFLNSLPKKYLEYDDARLQVTIEGAWFTAYLVARQYDKAKPYCERLLKLVSNSNFNELLKDNIYRVVSRYYVETGQYANASIYLAKNMDNLKALPDPKRIAATAGLLYKVDSAEGNFKSALNHLLVFKTLNDSIFNISKSRELQLLEVEYETEKKEDSLRLKTKDIQLLTEQNKYQKANLKQAAFFRNVTIGGILLTIIIIVLLYRQYKQKQESNRVITQKNDQLQHLLTEKEWLVKEIHHRVKNNFHVVASLLEIQSSYLKNKEALSAIKESQHRIHSMSIIHQKLYQSDTLSTINMPEYIYELVEYLRESYGIRENVIFTLDIENIELNHAVAITLGLILNEAITNSIKYAFTSAEEGRISISLNRTSGSQMLLSISDNGRGLPPDFKNVGVTMGMELLQGLLQISPATLALKAVREPL